MSAAEMLEELAARQVLLTVADGALTYRAPAGALTPDLRARLAEHREELLLHLAAAAEEPLLPLLVLYLDEEGRPWESWLVALPSMVALFMKALRPPVVAVRVPGTPWGRADMPAGALPEELLDRIMGECPPGVARPTEALLDARGRHGRRAASHTRRILRLSPSIDNATQPPTLED